MWGTFDLLHAGHIEYLKKARALGDYLIVAVYSDAVVARRSGKTRPLVPQKERMELVSALAFVDRVILLTNKSPRRKIEKLTPDIVASCDTAEGRDLEAAVDKMNIQFIRIKLRSRQSTEKIIQSIQKSFPDKKQ